MGWLLLGRFHHLVCECLGLDQLQPGQHVIVLRRWVLLNREAKRKKEVLPPEVVVQNLVQPHTIEGDRTRGGLTSRALERQRSGIASDEKVPAVGAFHHEPELQLELFQPGRVRFAQTLHVRPEWFEEIFSRSWQRLTTSSESRAHLAGIGSQILVFLVE